MKFLDIQSLQSELITENSEPKLIKFFDQDHKETPMVYVYDHKALEINNEFFTKIKSFLNLSNHGARNTIVDWVEDKFDVNINVSYINYN